MVRDERTHLEHKSAFVEIFLLLRYSYSPDYSSTYRQSLSNPCRLNVSKWCLGGISCVVTALQFLQTENEIILLWVKVKKIDTEYKRKISHQVNVRQGCGKTHWEGWGWLPAKVLQSPQHCHCLYWVTSWTEWLGNLCNPLPVSGEPCIE